MSLFKGSVWRYWRKRCIVAGCSSCYVGGHGSLTKDEGGCKQAHKSADKYTSFLELGFCHDWLPLGFFRVAAWLGSMIKLWQHYCLLPPPSHQPHLWHFFFSVTLVMPWRSSKNLCLHNIFSLGPQQLTISCLHPNCPWYFFQSSWPQQSYENCSFLWHTSSQCSWFSSGSCSTVFPSKWVKPAMSIHPNHIQSSFKPAYVWTCTRQEWSNLAQHTVI